MGSNKNTLFLNIVALAARVHVHHALGNGLGSYLGEAQRDSFSSPMAGDSEAIITLYFPVSFSVFAELEHLREDKDIFFQLRIAYTVIDLTQQGSARFIQDELREPRTNQQYLS